MTESLQTDECLASQTQSCCEGGRRPFKERTWLDQPSGQCVVMPVDFREITPQFSKEQVDKIAAIADGTDEVAQVIQERESVYGPPSVNLDCIARHWQAYLDNRNPGPLTLQDVCNMMCLAKISRMARTPEHPDSVKDIKAYRQIAETESASPPMSKVCKQN